MSSYKSNSIPNGYIPDSRNLYHVENQYDQITNAEAHDAYIMFKIGLEPAELTAIISYFTTSFPRDINIENQNIVLNVLQTLYIESPEQWEIEVKKLIEHVKTNDIYALMLKEKYLSPGGADSEARDLIDHSRKIGIVHTQLLSDLLESTRMTSYTRTPAIAVDNIADIADGNKAACESLLLALDDTSFYVQSIAQDRLNEITDFPDVNEEIALSAFKKISNPDVKAGLLNALGKSAPSNDSMQDFILSTLKTNDTPFLRAQAAETLTPLINRDEVFQQLLDSLKNDSDSFVRSTVVGILEEIITTNEQARNALINALHEDESEDVRQQAAESLSLAETVNQ